MPVAPHARCLVAEPAQRLHGADGAPLGPEADRGVDREHDGDRGRLLQLAEERGKQHGGGEQTRRPGLASWRTRMTRLEAGGRVRSRFGPKRLARLLASAVVSPALGSTASAAASAAAVRA